MSSLASPQYVTTGIALVAFAIVAALIAYRTRLNYKTRAISRAPADRYVQVVQDLAGEYGIPTEHLSAEQAAEVIFRTINIRKLYAIIGLLTATLIAIVAIVAIIYNQNIVTTNHVGPLRLRPGETKPIPLTVGSSGTVELEIVNIAADWAEAEQKKSDWLSAGRGLTPEIWFSICSAQDAETCRAKGHQRGTNTKFQKQLSSGPASVVFFNFRDNPPLDLTANIRY